MGSQGLNLLKQRVGQLRKKRSFWIITIVALAIIIAAIIFFVLRTKGQKSLAAEMTVQSAAAETGSISTTVVGTGSLASGPSTDVVVPTGIKVKEVLVESGDVVEAGQTLATLDATSIAEQLLTVKENIESVQDNIDNLSSEASDSSTTEYLEAQVLNGQLTELKEAEAALTTLMETQVITAAASGTVDSVNVTADSEITQSTANTSSGNSSSQGTSSSSTGGNIQTAAQAETGGSQVQFMTLTADVTDTVKTVSVNEISKCDNLTVDAPETGKKPQNEIEETEEYTGTISWNCTQDKFQENTVYFATIVLTAKDGHQFAEDIIPGIKGATLQYEVVGSGNQNKLRIVAEFAKTGESNQGNTDKNDGNQTAGTVSEDAGTASGGSASGGSASGNSGGASASGGTSSSGGTASQSSSDNESGTSGTQYSIYEAAAFTIASDEQVVVSINVDELDILSVKKDQAASITLDALDGQEFEGTITGISTTAVSGSSSVKYPVEITLDKTDEMLLGMSASATIHIDESDDAVLIPASALQEKGNQSFVYTEKDADGNLSGEVEVETGLSDGSQVEIVSGLKEGDQVYYLKSESTDSSEMSQDMMRGGQGGRNFEGSDMPSGGMSPDGGSMPEGGPQGGQSK